VIGIYQGPGFAQDDSLPTSAPNSIDIYSKAVRNGQGPATGNAGNAGMGDDLQLTTSWHPQCTSII